ncbi:MAG: gluconate 2-dehydrogenase subunit 3 family protein [Paucibacter sp.]|nr:gluconate 2-dehydrogenase subunit 3 family protein [Roseateles sp.]
MDRRTSLQWLLAASASSPALASAKPTAKPVSGIGSDPDVVRRYKSGDLWPLSFTERERRCASALCGLIIPADDRSPSAAELKVEAFIDEWISAPYEDQKHDRALVLKGLAWLDAESERRFGVVFAAATAAQQSQIADTICSPVAKDSPLVEQVNFFARFRDLTAGGFYTTPEGMKDLGYVGNTPSQTFDGPPAAVLKIVGVS